MKTEFLRVYIKNLIKWLLVSAVIGVCGGGVGCAFHLCLDFVADLNSEFNYILYFLPIGGVVIALLYSICKRWGRLDTNRVISAANENESIPLVMTPLIFISTLITHLLGGSAGREGAALQLGGSIGYNIGKVFKLNKNDLKIIVMSGMAAVFSALFGTPITAAVFAIEVICVGSMKYSALFPCSISAVVSYLIASFCGLSPVRFNVVMVGVCGDTIVKTVIIAALCALLSIIFCILLKKGEKYSKKLIPNIYIRGFVGGGIIVLLTYAVACRDYNGAGMNIIAQAMDGVAKPEAFMLKMLFTVVTISAGFKGGEIVPSFFIGSTFGCVLSGIIGFPTDFGAAIGFIAFFCGVVNCPIASILLSVEVFGGESVLLFAFACVISFMMSGKFSLYESQKCSLFEK